MDDHVAKPIDMAKLIPGCCKSSYTSTMGKRKKSVSLKVPLKDV